MPKLHEDGSLTPKSAYEANKLALANGFDRLKHKFRYGLSLDDRPTLGVSNEVAFFNKTIGYDGTHEGQHSAHGFVLTDTDIRDENGLPKEGSWYHPDWQPPESWADSGLTPPGNWPERTITVPPERAKVIMRALRRIANNSWPEKNAGEKPSISRDEASFIMNVINRADQDVVLAEAEPADQTRIAA